MRQAPASPGRVWVPGPGQQLPAGSAGLGADPELELPGSTPVDLPELVALSLANDPATQAVWNRARTQAARYGETRSGYYPRIDGGVGIAYDNRRLVQFTPQLEQKDYGPFGTLVFLLLDFGGRSASVESARLALLAANWEHNQAIQDTLFTTLRAYYLHVAAREALEASKANVQDSRVVLAATRAQFEDGAGIRAQVLQSESELARANLEVIKSTGAVEISLGKLATAVGLPPDTPLEVRMGAVDSSLPRTRDPVDQLIARSIERRPALQAARAEVAARREDIERARSDALPRLSVDAYAAQRWYIGECPGCLELFGPRSRQYDGPAGNYGARLAVSGPLFDGFANWNRIRAREAAAEAAESEIREQEQLVATEVWEAYYRHQAAEGRVRAARLLLLGAEESYRVNLASFRVGAANSVELVMAYQVLAGARAEMITARAEIQISLAALLRAVGILGPGRELEGAD